MRKLDILVPQYKETDEVIKPLLDSILVQQNVDFNEIGVIIVNDGTDVYLSDKLLTSYPFTIEYYKEEHRGVSGTRNACFDHSSAEYVMFCDADDMFFNACGLWMIFNDIENGRFDTLCSKFVEEVRQPVTKNANYINRENDTTFVHGKVMRRKFLINNNIRWNQNLTIHEDSYFNCLCAQLARRNTNGYKYQPTAFYLWKWRDESVCRRDPLYINKTYINMYESNTALIHEFLDRNMKEDAMSCIVSLVYETYCFLQSSKWESKESLEFLPQTLSRFKKYWIEFKNLFNEAPQQMKINSMSSIRTKYFQQGLLSEKMTFNDWLTFVEKYEG